MRVDEKLMTPAQKARQRRDEEIVTSYEKALGEVENLSVTHFCNLMAEKLGISWRTVYTVLREYQDGRAE